MQTLKTKFGNIREMLNKDQMKQIKGGQGYQCCPGPGNGTIGCSQCVTVSPGQTATCTLGTLTAC